MYTEGFRPPPLARLRQTGEGGVTTTQPLLPHLWSLEGTLAWDDSTPNTPRLTHQRAGSNGSSGGMCSVGGRGGQRLARLCVGALSPSPGVSTCLYCFSDGNFLKVNSCPEAELGCGEPPVFLITPVPDKIR